MTELKEDDPEHIRALLRFLYGLDYVDKLTPDTMALHVHVYVVADKHDMPELKRLAVLNFRSLAEVACLTDEATHFIEALQVIYNTSLSGDCTLRSDAFALCRRHQSELANNAAFRIALRDMVDLAIELATGEYIDANMKWEVEKYIQPAYRCGTDGCWEAWSANPTVPSMQCPYCHKRISDLQSIKIGTVDTVIKT